MTETTDATRASGATPLDALDERLRQWEHERDLSGIVLVTRADDTVFEGCYGFADRACGAPVTPRTRFATASVTKMFTAVAVADLVNAGSLRFDARVVDLLPAGRRPATLRDDVTVHHLLVHTSGIADYCEEDEDAPNYLADYGDLWDDRPVQRMLRPADFLPLFGDLPPYRAPGERWQYSNAGYVVLGLVVEEVTGRPYTEVVQERVLARAGMADSGFFRSDEARPDVAVGYLPRTSADAPWRTNVHRVPVVGGADGGALATAGDVDRFLRRLADGTLLGPLTDTLLARHVELRRGYAHGYGVLHGRDGRWGHEGGDPGVECFADRFDVDDVHVVVLCNGEGLSDDVDDLVVDAARDAGVLTRP